MKKRLVTFCYGTVSQAILCEESFTTFAKGLAFEEILR